MNDSTEFRQADVDQSVCNRFEQMVSRYSDNLAVQTEHASLRYDELNAQSNQIAHAIRLQAGTTPARIALLLEHDAPLITAILGVLKSGNAYVPLDPEYPPQRTQYILRDADAQLILTDSKNSVLSQSLTQGCVVLNVDQIDPSLDTANPNLQISPDALAYLMYTSGTTGQPKGVMQTHRNLLHHIRNYTHGLRIRAEDRLTLFFSCSFSASLMDIFGALLNGAALFPYYLKTRPIMALRDWLISKKISLFHSNPGVFRQFCGSLPEGYSFPDLRAFDVAGEPFYQTDWELFKRHFSPGYVLVNHLACTEASVVTQYRIDNTTSIDTPVVPVGFEAQGIQLSIIDEDGQEVPPGVTGELVIQSRYLSPGYWNKPELTDAAFTTAPNDATQRVFRTGDLGSKDADGCFTHLGRKDSRVKIRGYSVELAEVEGVLRKHPSVKDAAVVAHQQRRGHTSLVAYFVPQEADELRVRDLRLHMRKQVPDFMTPALFVSLESLPVNPNGKLDRRALPPIDQHRPSLDCEFLAPRNILEQRLRDIWERVLGVSPIGVRDPFDDLGGDSLLAVEMLAEIEKAFDQHLPSSVMIEIKTIESLANMLNDLRTKPHWQPLVCIRAGSSHKPLFCVHSGGGLFPGYDTLTQLLDSEQPVYGLQPSGQDGQQPVHHSVEGFARCYCREIRKVQPKGPFRIMGFSFGGLVAYEMAQQLHRMGEGVALLALLDPPVFNRSGLSWKRIGHWKAALDGRPTVDRLRPPFEYLGLVRRRCPIPLADRGSFFMGIARQASRKYTPRPYRGPAFLFKCDMADMAIWNHLLQGQTTVHDVGCPHGDLLRTPQAERVAKILDEALASVRDA